MNKIKPKVLDCTLRDGGYYNKWNFDIDIINQYLNAMKIAKVDVVELGFRFLKSDSFLGSCAFSKDNFLENLTIPSSLEVAVMVNCSDLINESGWKNTMKLLFPNQSDKSPVSIIRFACHFKDLETGLKASAWAHEKGYKVGVNLMQISDRTMDEIEEFTSLANEYPVDVLYIADSTGSLKPTDVKRIIKKIKSNWNGDVGVHMHDNLGLALSNSLEGYNEGAIWLDSTVTGMGRGPGNTKTEELLIELNSENDIDTVLPLLTLVNRHFNKLKSQYGWGTNPFYFLAGKFGIHPTFVQEILTDPRYNEADRLTTIKYLKVNPNKKFSIKMLEDSRNFYDKKILGNWNPMETFSEREVLIVGSGKSVLEHKLAIEQFIIKNKPLVLVLNSKKIINEDLIDFRIACHPLRVFSDSSKYSELGSNLIIPSSILNKTGIKFPSTLKTYDYGFSVQKNKFHFEDNIGISPSPSVISYALLVCSSGRANNILLAGIDGYSHGDSRNHELELLFDLYDNNEYTPKISAITDTRFNLEINSVYNHI
jgi:4-hydroxy 2-oxovalerate aldolase